MKLGSNVKFDYSFGDYVATVHGVILELNNTVAKVTFMLWVPGDDDPKRFTEEVEISKLEVID